MELFYWEHYWMQLLEEKALNLDGKISASTGKEIVWDDHFYLKLTEMLITNRMKWRPKGKIFFFFTKGVRKTCLSWWEPENKVTNSE